MDRKRAARRLFLTLACLAHVIPAAARQGWPMRGGDARNSGVSAHYGVRKGRLAWTIQSFDVPRLPAVAPDGTIYFCSGRTVGEVRGLLWALAPDGSEIWNVRMRDSQGRDVRAASTPLPSADGNIYVGWAVYTEAAMIRSVSFHAFGADGTQLWIFEPRIELATASVQQPIMGPDGTIYIALDTMNPGNERASIFALDSADGSVRWRFVSPRGDSFWTTPALGRNGKLYFQSLTFADSGAMYCLDAATGELEWTFAPVAGTQTDITVDNDGGVYLLNHRFGRWLTKLDADGNELWQYDPGRFGHVNASVAVHDGKAYVPVGGGENEGLHVLDAATGERLMILGQGRFPGSVAIDRSGNIFFWSDHNVRAYNPAGELWWESPFLGIGTFNAVVLGHNGLILANGGLKLHALDSSVLIGDLNCDAVIDAFDIGPFILILFDPRAYAAQFPDCDGPTAGDINVDGSINAFDIEPFLELLFP